MDDRTKPEHDSPDLSFLWPLIDRIRAVEFKFQDDGSAQANAGLEARLTTLEIEITAIRRLLQEAAGASDNGTGAEAPAATEPVELRSQSWTRAAFGSATAVALLVVAHYLAVVAFDLPAVILRLVSIAIPVPPGADEA